jgi:hypothetical protein
MWKENCVDVEPIANWPGENRRKRRPGKALVLDRKWGWVVAEVREGQNWWLTVPGAWYVEPTHFVDLPRIRGAR